MQEVIIHIVVQEVGRPQCRVYAAVQVGATPQCRVYTQEQGIRPNAQHTSHRCSHHKFSCHIYIFPYFFLLSHKKSRPTVMGPQKYKNETQKVVDFRGNYFCIFFFVCAPLWFGRINENKYENDTKVRGILAIQVSSPPI